MFTFWLKSHLWIGDGVTRERLLGPEAYQRTIPGSRVTQDLMEALREKETSAQLHLVGDL